LPRAGLETDLERWLLPKTENFLDVPVLHTFSECHVEIPEQQSDNQTHFKICKISANAVTSAVRERLEDIASIVVEGRRRIIVLFWQPTFGMKSLRVMKVDWRMIGRKLVHTNTSLMVSASDK